MLDRGCFTILSTALVVVVLVVGLWFLNGSRFQQLTSTRPAGTDNGNSTTMVSHVGNRVAVCFSGKVRSGPMRASVDNVRNNLIDSTHADLFMYVDKGGAAVDTPMAPAYSYDEYLTRLSPVIVEHYSNLEGELNLSLAPAMHGDCRACLRLRRFWPQFEAMRRCFALVQAHEKRRGAPYDFVIRARPDVTYDAPIVISNEMKRILASEQPTVWGQSYYRGNLLCDHFHVATRFAATFLFSSEYAFRNTSDLRVGGQHCCGGLVNEVPWNPPSFCNIPHTMVNETECIVSRWLRSNDVMEIPTNDRFRIRIQRWERVNETVVNLFSWVCARGEY